MLAQLIIHQTKYFCFEQRLAKVIRRKKKAFIWSQYGIVISGSRVNVVFDALRFGTRLDLVFFFFFFFFSFFFLRVEREKVLSVVIPYGVCDLDLEVT